VAVERVLDDRIVRRARGRLPVGGERRFGVALPGEDVASDGEQVSSFRRDLERALHHQQCLASLLLPEQCDRQVRGAERVGLVELCQPPEDGLGLGRPLVLELGEPDVAQLDRLRRQGTASLRQRDSRESGQAGTQQPENEAWWEQEVRGRRSAGEHCSSAAHRPR
jgi:hypothetical protein